MGALGKFLIRLIFASLSKLFTDIALVLRLCVTSWLGAMLQPAHSHILHFSKKIISSI